MCWPMSATMTNNGAKVKPNSRRNADDRSPCGTGTSAKLACLAADGKLKEGEVWRQESLIGSVFEGFVTYEGSWTIPHIRGTAYVNAESTLIVNPDDPFRMGIRG